MMTRICEVATTGIGAARKPDGINGASKLTSVLLL
jgi:hypothetical protein